MWIPYLQIHFLAENSLWPPKSALVWLFLVIYGHVHAREWQKPWSTQHACSHYKQMSFLPSPVLHFCVKWGSPEFCQKILKYLTIRWSCYFRWLPGVVPKCTEARACLREKMCVLDELCWTGCWPWINTVCEVRCLCTETHVKQGDVSVRPPLHSVTVVTRVFADSVLGQLYRM